MKTQSESSNDLESMASDYADNMTEQFSATYRPNVREFLKEAHISGYRQCKKDATRIMDKIGEMFWPMKKKMTPETLAVKNAKAYIQDQKDRVIARAKILETDTSFFWPIVENIMLNCYAEGYAMGHSDGYGEGESDGRESGYNRGYDAGHETGYDSGYETAQERENDGK